MTTARELELFGSSPRITAEAVVAHLVFTKDDYARLGTRIKCNPAIKTAADRDALRHALVDGRITTVGTDHAPHLLKDKEGGCARAALGMPMVQFSLVTMLELVDEGVLSMEHLVTLMAHNPATLFEVSKLRFCAQGLQGRPRHREARRSVDRNAGDDTEQVRLEPYGGSYLSVAGAHHDVQRTDYI